MSTAQDIQIHHDIGMRQAENLGLQDGNANTPSGDNNAKFSSEGITKGHYDGILARVQAEIGVLSGIRNDYEALSNQLEEINADPRILKSQVDTLTFQKDQELQSLEDQIHSEQEAAKNHPDYQSKRNEYIKAQTELDQIRARLGRSNLNKLNLGAGYYILLFLLGIGELPINRQVFELISDNVIETTITALILIVGIPIASHLSGVYLKRRSEKKEYLVLFIIVLIVVCITFLIIAYIRVIYFQKVNESTDNEWSSVILFFFLSFLIYSIGTWLSYSIHDESKEFEESHRKFENAKVNFNLAENALAATKQKIQQKKNSEIQRINQDFHARKNDISNTPANFKKKIQTLVTDYKKLRMDVISKQKNINSNYKMAVNKYRQTNLRARTDGYHPVEFNSLVWDLELQDIEDISQN